VVQLLRKALPLLTVCVVIAGAYDGWFFYSRWRDSREAEQIRQATETENGRQTIQRLGGDQFRILNFYASPARIHRGENSTICYGVYRAKSVRIEPPIGDAYPAVTRCLQVSPTKSTDYTLTAEDGIGHTATAQIMLQVTK